MKTKRKVVRAVALSSVAMIALFVARPQVSAQQTKSPYPKMFPVSQYLMERSAEIKLAQSAAPPSISNDAEVIVLGEHGYETAIKGKNGFVCAVVRSWTAASEDPQFWNPKVRAPICFNPAAARTYLPIAIRKTKLVLAGKSKDEMFAEISVALDRKEFPPTETGAMCYMMSKQGYLTDEDGHWQPHLMFFVPLADPTTWGANLTGSPIIGVANSQSRTTTFMVPVRRWSDGTPAPDMKM